MAHAQPLQESASPVKPLLAGSLRESTRIDLEREVSLSFEDLEGFMTEFSVNISTTGMFVRTAEPRPAGTMLGFALSLNDGQPLIRGHGEVVWVRRYDDGPERPAGMGIRFLDLDSESRRLIRWVIVRRCFQDEEKIDLSELQAAAAGTLATPDGDRSAGRASSELRRLYSFAGSASASRERRWKVRPRPLLTLTALATCCLYLFPGITESAAVTREGAPAEASEPAPAPATSAAVSEVAPPPQVAPPAIDLAPPAGPAEAPPSPSLETASVAETAAPVDTAPAATEASREQLAEAARAWARAWADQRVDDYLRSYAADFRPPHGLSREDWETERRARILKPRQIEVALGPIMTEPLGADRALVTFEQAYRSDSYRDTVFKTLELVREDGEWRIRAERVES